VFFFLRSRRKQKTEWAESMHRAQLRRAVTPPPSRRPKGVDVSAITVAIDWRERKALQKKLNDLAETGDTSTPGGLARMLHETVVELRRIEKSWLYAGAVNWTPGRARQAETMFRSIAGDMRSRYREEVVRAADGIVKNQDAPALRARPEEGPGVVVVTVLVAARGKIPDIAHAQNADHLRELMRALGGIGASRLMVLEVIWSPAVEEDRMSTAELELLYPELQRIDEHSIAGRVFCGYCAYPYAAEIMKCPQCGGPQEPPDTQT